MRRECGAENFAPRLHLFGHASNGGQRALQSHALIFIDPARLAGYLTEAISRRSALPASCGAIPRDNFGALWCAPPPADRRPAAFVKVVPGDFGNDLKAGNRPGKRNPAGHDQADCKRVQRSQRPPTDGLEDGSRVRFCAAE
jgi:hypothetical protein